jgi:hypothetical protein
MRNKEIMMRREILRRGEEERLKRITEREGMASVSECG